MQSPLDPTADTRTRCSAAACASVVVVLGILVIVGIAAIRAACAYLLAAGLDAALR
jgi:hypothetical protein